MALLDGFKLLQQRYDELKLDYAQLHQNHRAQSSRVQDVEKLVAFWKEETHRLSKSNDVQKDALQECYSNLALATATCDASASPEKAIQSWAELNKIIGQLRGQLEMHEHKAAEMRTHIAELERLNAVEDKASSEHKRQSEDLEREREQLVAQPLLAQVAELKRVIQRLRQQLGKNEMELQRKDTDFQNELSAMSRKLRSYKSQNESLIRKNNELKAAQGSTSAVEGMVRGMDMGGSHHQRTTAFR